MYRQKALDLRVPPALPKFIFLKRARGIEEVEEDSSDDDSDMGGSGDK